MRFTPDVHPNERVHVGFTWTPGFRNVRVPVQEPVQEAPDPIRQGAVPSRRPMVQVATFLYDQEAVSAGNMLPIPDPQMHHTAGRPHGRQDVWVERANIAPPSHIAYGSLFTYDPDPYGIG